MIRARVAVYWTPKAGHRADEYEDACWPEECQEVEAAGLRFAVADGATESCFAGRWARQLVQAAGEGRISLADPAAGIAELQQQWREWLAGQTLPWYAEESANGSDAALVMLVLEEDSALEAPGKWQALALGDSCVVQVRDDAIVARFPLQAAADFNNRPHLIGSNAEQTGFLEEQFRPVLGTWKVGDIFFLMTDALACWFMQSAEGGERPWQALQGLSAADDFARWIGELRSSRRMRNDDCTLISIEICRAEDGSLTP